MRTVEEQSRGNHLPEKLVWGRGQRSAAEWRSRECGGVSPGPVQGLGRHPLFS